MTAAGAAREQSELERDARAGQQRPRVEQLLLLAVALQVGKRLTYHRA